MPFKNFTSYFVDVKCADCSWQYQDVIVSDEGLQSVTSEASEMYPACMNEHENLTTTVVQMYDPSAPESE